MVVGFMQWLMNWSTKERLFKTSKMTADLQIICWIDKPLLQIWQQSFVGVPTPLHCTVFLKLHWLFFCLCHMLHFSDWYMPNPVVSRGSLVRVRWYCPDLWPGDQSQIQKNQTNFWFGREKELRRLTRWANNHKCRKKTEGKAWLKRIG